jgi:hypothetical protein
MQNQSPVATLDTRDSDENVQATPWSDAVTTGCNTGPSDGPIPIQRVVRCSHRTTRNSQATMKITKSGWSIRRLWNM